MVREITFNDIKRMVSESVRSVKRLICEDEEGLFVPTEAWAVQKYDEFNRMYFDGFLPKCKIKVIPLKENQGFVKAGYMKMSSTGGCLTLDIYYSERYGYMKVNKDTINKTLKPVIAINSNYTAPEESVENTLIHEMCHFYTWFNPDGTIRTPDRENNGHGQDFMEIAEKVNKASGGKIEIKQLLTSEEIRKYKASVSFNKEGYKICVAKYNKENPNVRKGEEVFWYTKDRFAAQFGLYCVGAEDCLVTENPQLLMLIKRSKCKPSLWRVGSKSPTMNVYKLSGEPECIREEFNASDYVTVNRDNILEILK